MPAGQVVYYDYDHCAGFLSERAEERRQTEPGLAAMAIHREIVVAFAAEALAESSFTLGQFDRGLVFLFTPEKLLGEAHPRGNALARTKAIDLMGARDTRPPVEVELRAAEQGPPPVSPGCRLDTWMPSDLLDGAIRPGRVEVRMFFDAGSYFDEALLAAAEHRGLTVIDDYETSARTGELRLRDPDQPGKLIRVPWMRWVREMMCGGYGLGYLLVCTAAYMKLVDRAR